MQKDKKPLYKSVVFWQILVAVIVIIALGVGIMLSLMNSGIHRRQEAEETYHRPTETTAEPTLPPPPPNPYRTTDFYLEGGYMTCGAGKSSLGIDVSYWQHDIDWQQVKDAGMEFAFIRVGYRGSEEGILDTDSYAQQNYEGAKAAGIKVGAYIFSQAVNPQEAVEEAEFLLEQIEGWDVEMPIVFDWEFVSEESRTGKMDSREITDCALAFCRRIEEAGHKPMVYFNKNHSHRSLILEELVDYEFWLAMYDHVMDYPYQVDFWQYTDKGTVPGIEGDVDINIWLHYDE